MRVIGESKVLAYRLAAVTIVFAVLAAFLALRAFAQRHDGVTLVRSIPNDPDAGDAAVISELQKAGSDVTREASMIHYLYVPSEEDAHEAAEALTRLRATVKRGSEAVTTSRHVQPVMKR
jgi:hypothetical protein